MLREPGGEGVTRVLVEGGPTIAGAFLAADLVDEVVIAHGTEPLGAAAASRSATAASSSSTTPRAGRSSTSAGSAPTALTVYRRVGRFARRAAA